MPYSANITDSRINGRFFMLTADAFNALSPGETKIYLAPESDTYITGIVAKLPGQNQGTVRCAAIYNGEAESSLPLPLQLGDVLEYDIHNREIRLLAIVRGESPEDTEPPPAPTKQKSPAPTPPTPLLPPTDPPHLDPGANANPDDVVAALIRWIHDDPFQRSRRAGGQILAVAGSEQGAGWDFRIKDYAYSRQPHSCFQQVYADTAPHITALQAIIAAYDWLQITEPDQITPEHHKILESEAQWICEDWGGVRQRAGYADTWRVIRSAVTGTDDVDAPMSSGWTKVASFATDGLPNGQTIWDSRVATSIICRIDKILHANGLTTDTVADLTLGTIPALNSGTRPRPTTFNWPNGYGKWQYHFGGSEVVRRIVKILNDPAHNYPRMPRPDGSTADWDVFGVGLVLFMDGY